MNKRTILEIIQSISFLASLVTAGAFYGVVIIWDEVEMLPNYNEFAWWVDRDVTNIIIACGVFGVTFIITSIILFIDKRRSPKCKLCGKPNKELGDNHKACEDYEAMRSNI